MSSLTKEEWLNLIEFYNEGHTMLECAAIYGVSNASVSRYFKKNGVSAREAFVPSRKEKVSRMKGGQEQTVPEEWLEEYSSSRVKSGGKPPIRKIIKRNEDDVTLYEKDIE